MKRNRYKGYRNQRVIVFEANIGRTSQIKDHLQCKKQTYVRYASYPAAGALSP